MSKLWNFIKSLFGMSSAGPAACPGKPGCGRGRRLR